MQLQMKSNRYISKEWKKNNIVSFMNFPQTYLRYLDLDSLLCENELV